jgi:hypothetical protein
MNLGLTTANSNTELRRHIAAPTRGEVIWLIVSLAYPVAIASLLAFLKGGVLKEDTAASLAWTLFKIFWRVHSDFAVCDRSDRFTGKLIHPVSAGTENKGDRFSRFNLIPQLEFRAPIIYVLAV